MNTNPISEFYKIYRPKTLKEVVGQPEAVKMLSEMIKNNRVPRTLLFTGPSGCGKTTFSRIVKDALKCGNADFYEVNCAETRGIDDMRAIKTRMTLCPVSGNCRVWLLDEVHMVTREGQSSILKLLEDTPSHVYFFLATTDPGKLLPTILTRCTEIKVRSLNERELKEVVNSVLEKEKKKLDEEVLEKLVSASDGSARKALVILNQIIGLTSPEEQIEAIVKQDVKKKGIDIARLLLNPSSKWVQVAKLIKELDEEPETVRHIVLGYSSSVMLNNPKLADRCYLILCAFENNFYDSKKAGLIRACYDVLSSK